ncbi:hypothetical protein [Siphonobacter aquaeclarae]|uniref:Lipoprotein n=1 Tax=Siphonobacter aquaeclarae TaxID=563176 RepID=A0A1G9W6U7_9BACT|nr:hypothetical protein [Siphonobacter aquaeclarae]SDM79957.1 hypothetical protein SAMN04488090_4264 [Siphonobacter aquaeclarae]
MKLTSHLILFGSMVMAVTSCNFVSKAKETAENAQNVAQAAENIAKSGETISKRVEARRAKGDTLAMPYKELANFMPSGVSGYEPAHDPAGQTMNMQGFSYSSYEQEYKKGEESTVKIQLIDYNAAAALLSMSTMALATGIEMENESQITKSWNPGVDDVKGYEEYGKQSKDAKVILSVADRFFVQVSATNQPNTDFVKEVAKSIKLSDLANH